MDRECIGTAGPLGEGGRKGSDEGTEGPSDGGAEEDGRDGSASNGASDAGSSASGEAGREAGAASSDAGATASDGSAAASDTGASSAETGTFSDGGATTSDGSAGMSDTGVSTTDGGGSPPDAGSAVACAKFDAALVNITLRTAAGAAPSPSGGVVGAGVYRASEGYVYGTGQNAGLPAGTFAGYVRIQKFVDFEELHESSLAGSFSGKGTSSLSGNSLVVTYSCASDGSKSATFPYAVINTSSFRVQVPGGYPTWVTYALQGTP